MIGLLIQDNAYEQDIRELLMSFYPGETYAHEVKEGGDLYEMRVEYMSEMDSYSVMEYYYDGGGYNPKDNGENIPASEYVHADWETPTWPEF